MRQERLEIADEFFDKQDVTTVDFEITFAALLATALISFPVEHHILFGQVAAFSLLSITLIRRMAITSPFAPEEQILGRTTPVISFVSASAILYLFVAMLPLLNALIPPISGVILFCLFVLAIMIIAVVGQELLFRDYLPWWYVKFKQKSEQRELFDTLWKDAAMISYWASTARRNRETYRELGNRMRGNRPDLSDFDFTIENAGRYLLAASLLLVFLYLIPVIYSVYVFGLEGVLVIPAVVAIHDHSAFLYIAYGNPSFEDLRQHVLSILIRTGLYVTELAFLLSHLNLASLF